MNSYDEKKGYGTKLIKTISEFLREKEAMASAELFNECLANVFRNNGWHRRGNVVMFGIDIAEEYRDL